MAKMFKLKDHCYVCCRNRLTLLNSERYAKEYKYMMTLEEILPYGYICQDCRKRREKFLNDRCRCDSNRVKR